MENDKNDKAKELGMEDGLEMKILGRIYNDFPTKFGVPRQSGLVEDLKARIVFEPPYRNPDVVRGLEQYSHIWILWQFSRNIREGWSATVRPPRLGGNVRMGVFASRSPFRPNPIGMSSVRLDRIELDPALGPVIWVSGADLVDQTPIFDIKPYLPYVDSHPQASNGFAHATGETQLSVVFQSGCLEGIPEEKRKALIGILGQDPRPAYQDAPERIYGMEFAGFEIKFFVDGRVLTVVNVEKARE